MVSVSPRRTVALVALVAEDEPVFRMETADMLTDVGFSVIETSDAAAALAHFERHDSIALLFTDVRMPGRLDGLGLAHEIARRWPDTRIIVCSAVKGITASMMPDDAVFFDKPYLPKKVLAAVERVVGSAHPE